MISFYVELMQTRGEDYSCSRLQEDKNWKEIRFDVGAGLRIEIQPWIDCSCWWRYWTWRTNLIADYWSPLQNPSPTRSRNRNRLINRHLWSNSGLSRQGTIRLAHGAWKKGSINKLSIWTLSCRVVHYLIELCSIARFLARVLPAVIWWWNGIACPKWLISILRNLCISFWRRPLLVNGVSMCSIRRTDGGEEQILWK